MIEEELEIIDKLLTANLSFLKPDQYKFYLTINQALSKIDVALDSIQKRNENPLP